jgi:hypothetical protein
MLNMMFSLKWFGRLFLPDDSTLHDQKRDATPNRKFSGNSSGLHALVAACRPETGRGELLGTDLLGLLLAPDKNLAANLVLVAAHLPTRSEEPTAVVLLHHNTARLSGVAVTEEEDDGTHGSLLSVLVGVDGASHDAVL